MTEEQSFVRSVLSEPDGTGSAARVYTLLLVVAVLSWVSYLVLRDHKLPELGGATTFLVGGSTALYGLNKITTAVTKVKENECHL